MRATFNNISNFKMRLPTFTKLAAFIIYVTMFRTWIFGYAGYFRFLFTHGFLMREDEKGFPGLRPVLPRGLRGDVRGDWDLHGIYVLSSDNKAALVVLLLHNNTIISQLLYYYKT